MSIPDIQELPDIGTQPILTRSLGHTNILSTDTHDIENNNSYMLNGLAIRYFIKQNFAEPLILTFNKYFNIYNNQLIFQTARATSS